MNMIIRTFAIAIIYAFTGYIGQLISLPPGNVTFLWPPSGIALSAIILLGASALPGIFFGALVINGWTFFNGWSFDALTVQTSIGIAIAIGSCLQPLAGKYLIDRFIRSANPFSSFKTSSQFAVIALLICLISSSIGVTSLLQGSYIQFVSLQFTWLTWWAGDLIGIIIFTPVILLLSRMSLNRAGIIVAILVVGLIASNMLSRVLREEAERNWKAQAEQSAERATSTFLFWLDITYAPIKSLALIFNSSSNVTEKEFLDAAGAFKDQEDGLIPDAIAFVRKQKFTSNASARYIVDYSTDKSGFLSPGSEVTENPLVKAAAKSAEANKNQLTIGALQTSKSSDASAFVAITVRNGEQEGIIIGKIGLNNLIDGLYNLRVPTGLHLMLRGRAADTPEKNPLQRLYHHGAKHHTAEDITSIRTKSAKADLEFSWSVSSDFIGGANVQSSSILLVGGSIVTLMISLFTLFLFEQNRKVQQRVLDRTAQLISSERRLLDILKQSPMGVAISDISKEGIIHYANPRFAEMFGLEVEDLIGAQANGLYANPEDRFKIIKEFEEKGAVGRELRMIDLKKEINELMEETGSDAPYDVLD